MTKYQPKLTPILKTIFIVVHAFTLDLHESEPFLEEIPKMAFEGTDLALRFNHLKQNKRGANERPASAV